MKQPTIWSSLNLRPHPEEIARRDNVPSSHEAAQTAVVRAGTQAATIVDCLHSQGVVMTAKQIADHTGIAPYIVRKRLPPLERRGIVYAINRYDMKPGDVLRWLHRSRRSV